MKDSHFNARHRNEDKTATGVLAKKKSRKGKPKVRATEGQCSQGDSCVFKHDPSKKNEGMGRERSPSPSRTPRRNSTGDVKGKGDAEPSPTGTSPSGKQCRPLCRAFEKGNCEKGSACDHWHSLEFAKSKTLVGCKHGETCVCRHIERSSPTDDNRRHSATIIVKMPAVPSSIRFLKMFKDRLSQIDLY